MSCGSPFRVNNRKVKVLDPPDPSNINFENLEYNSFQKFIRRQLVNLISVLLIFTSFFVTTFVYSRTSSEGDSTRCETVLTKDEFNGLESPTESQIKCFCNSLPIDEQLKGEFSDTCKEYASSLFFSILVGVGASFILNIANFIIQTCQKLFSKFAKYHTYIEEYNSLLTKIYIPIFVNTALLTPLIYSRILGIRPGAFLMKLYSGNDDFETYNSLSLDWFLKVGVALTTSMTVNVFTPIIGILKNPLLFFFKKIFVRGITTKRRIIEYLKPAQFGFHYRSAYGLMICSFCLIFEPMLPFTPILCAGNLWLAYISNKVSF